VAAGSARRCGMAESDVCLDMEPWRHRWCEESWRRFLEAGETESELRALRRRTDTGRPLLTYEEYSDTGLCSAGVPTGVFGAEDSAATARAVTIFCDPQWEGQSSFRNSNGTRCGA